MKKTKAKPNVTDKEETPGQISTLSPVQPQEVSWTASEFIHHHKQVGWFIGLGIVSIVATIIIYVLTRDVFSTLVVVVAAIIFGVSASHTPRTLDYKIDHAGIHIGNKSYAYDQFKYFALIDDNGVSSIWFMPIKRYMYALTVYYLPEQESAITAVLSNYLPLEEHEPDTVDRLMKQIRF